LNAGAKAPLIFGADGAAEAAPLKTKSPLQNTNQNLRILMRFKRASRFADDDKESIGAVDSSVQREASRSRNRRRPTTG
jgi:hypothetical protein